LHLFLQASLLVQQTVSLLNLVLSHLFLHEQFLLGGCVVFFRFDQDLVFIFVDVLAGYHESGSFRAQKGVFHLDDELTDILSHLNAD
jgi:hypothetical protein